MREADRESPFTLARMIVPLSDAGTGGPQPFLRKTFKLGGAAKAASLTISALGLYRCLINGKRVGEDLLTPGWTTYKERLAFQSYDVAAHLKPGDNTIDIWLGDGWYRSVMLWRKIQIENTWGDKIGAIAELSVDGAVALATDDSWSSGVTPIVKSGIYFGEHYDARLEGSPADKAVKLHPGFDPKVLIPHEILPVREIAKLAVVESWKDEQGRTIYDFGQNAAGYAAFDVTGERGARVTIEHSEIVDGEKKFRNENMRLAPVKIVYDLKGGGTEHFAPHFTFFGYRYVRVTIVGKAEIKHIESRPISSAHVPAASFTSGHKLVNRLVENTLWSLRSNFIEVPTDCPQRDERIGWTGDAQVFAPTACYLNNSHDFLAKYLRDVMADQRPDGAIPHFSPDPTRDHQDIAPGFAGSTGWGDAIAIIPHVLWTHYGDKQILKDTLPAMTRWVDYVWSISEGPIVRPPRAWGGRGFTFGDWLQPGGPTEKPLPTIGDDAAATIYLFITSKLIAEIAGIVGDAALEKRMRDRAETVKKAFASEFITPSGRLAYDDQTSYALAIVHDLIPEDRRKAAAGYFKATIDRAGYKIGTGFIGTPALLPALMKIGEPELAARVFLQEEVPGWLYQVKNGATTIWERWDAIKADGTIFDPQMNSYNHYAYGAVCQWLFEAVAGFRPDPKEPGFKHIVFEPLIIPELSPVAASHASQAGEVKAAWALSGQKVTYDITVPDVSRATFIPPAGSGNVTIAGKSVTGPQTLAGGNHRIVFELPKKKTS